jgi:hypothetical protein
MFAPATPLVPDDQDHERNSFRAIWTKNANKGSSWKELTAASRFEGRQSSSACRSRLLAFAGGFAWHRPYDPGNLTGRRKRDRHGLGSVLGTVLGAH